MGVETNNSTNERLDEISLRLKNELTRKMGDEIKRWENGLLKVLNYLSENSLRNDHNSPSAGMMSDGENTILVELASHGLVSDQENIDPNESFVGAQKPIWHSMSVNASLGSIFSWSETSPWDASWTEIAFSPSDIIPPLGLLWSLRSEFSDREFKAFSISFSHCLISSLLFRVDSFFNLKDISSNDVFLCYQKGFHLSFWLRGFFDGISKKGHFPNIVSYPEFTTWMIIYYGTAF